MPFPAGWVKSFGYHGPWLTPVLFSITFLGCDLVETLAEDVRLTLEHKFSFPIFVYWVSRLSTYSFFMNILLHPYCRAERNSIEPGQWPLVIHRTSTSLLLYIRVFALYRSNRYVQGFFSLYLFAIVASSILALYRVFSHVLLSEGLNFTSVVLLGFETCVVVAVAYKVKVDYIPEEEGENGWWLWLLGIFSRRSMHRLAARFLQDNLIYYLITVFVKSIQIVVMFRGEWYLADISLYLDVVCVCVFACKIFRNMKLGLPGLVPRIHTTQSNLDVPPLEFASAPSRQAPDM